MSYIQPNGQFRRYLTKTGIFVILIHVPPPLIPLTGGVRREGAILGTQFHSVPASVPETLTYRTFEFYSVELPQVKLLDMEEEDGDMEQGHLDHMKGVMLHIIRCSIEEKERELREDGIPNPRGAVPFGEVINLLYNSDMLQHETRAVLTVQKAFVCLLTLTNENSFYLQKDDKDEDFLIMYDPRNY